MKLLFDLRTLLIALWLGAALFFSFAVAPSAFAALPSRELAGAIVNRTLAIVNYSGIIVGLILLASSFIKTLERPVGREWTEKVVLFTLVAACAIGQFVIAAKLHELRASIGRPIEELSETDALRVAFGSWHVYSVWTLMTAIIAAVVGFFLIARRARNANYR